MSNLELQNKLDIFKWLESEQKLKDMCGKYDFCNSCDKSQSMPCAAASERFELQKATIAEASRTANIGSEMSTIKDCDSIAINNSLEKRANAVDINNTKALNGNDVKISTEIGASVKAMSCSLGKKFELDMVLEKKANRKSLSFAEKYALADDIVKERYEILKTELLKTPHGTPKIKSRISKQCDTYRREGDIVAKVTIIGTSLRVNLPLDPFAEEFCDGKTPHVATGHKKVYEHVPFQFKVNSKLAMKRVLKLVSFVK